MGGHVWLTKLYNMKKWYDMVFKDAQPYNHNSINYALQISNIYFFIEQICEVFFIARHM